MGEFGVVVPRKEFEINKTPSQYFDNYYVIL